MTRRLAVIPARGGSVRIPRKNLRRIGGQPAFLHPALAAVSSGAFDTVHVSTEDPEIREVAAAHGLAPPFDRPAALADDATTIRQVVGWTFRACRDRGTLFDTVALVYATAFLIQPGMLAAAAQRFDEDPGRPLLSVTEIGAPLHNLFVGNDNTSITRVAETAWGAAIPRPGHCFRDAGAFCFFAAEHLADPALDSATFAFRPYRLPRWQAIDIDTEEDWSMAEALFKGGVKDQLFNTG